VVTPLAVLGVDPKDAAVGHALGLRGAARAERYVPCRNAAASSRVYTVEPRDLLRADREAQDAGLELVGVVHSHTHTPAYPSATDIAAAVDPDWHYAIVSLALGEPVVRSYLIAEGTVTEEPVVVGAAGSGNRSGHAPVGTD
jgi:proteasome lid subunit RPN8/RPN11